MHGCIGSSLVFMLSLIVNDAYSWNIGQKIRSPGPTIHKTYFTTPNNAKIEVRAQAYLGKLVSGSCQYSMIYDIGREFLQTGDIIAIDGFALRALISTRYNCMTIFYTANQRVMESFLLFFDGANFISTYPFDSEVIIAKVKAPSIVIAGLMEFRRLG